MVIVSTSTGQLLVGRIRDRGMGMPLLQDFHGASRKDCLLQPCSLVKTRRCVPDVMNSRLFVWALEAHRSFPNCGRGPCVGLPVRLPILPDHCRFLLMDHVRRVGDACRPVASRAGLRVACESRCG